MKTRFFVLFFVFVFVQQEHMCDNDSGDVELISRNRQQVSLNSGMLPHYPSRNVLTSIRFFVLKFT